MSQERNLLNDMNRKLEIKLFQTCSVDELQALQQFVNPEIPKWRRCESADVTQIDSD